MNTTALSQHGYLKIMFRNLPRHVGFIPADDRVLKGASKNALMGGRVVRIGAAVITH
jgi:hypothetical protein